MKVHVRLKKTFRPLDGKSVRNVTFNVYGDIYVAGNDEPVLSGNQKDLSNKEETFQEVNDANPKC